MKRAVMMDASDHVATMLVTAEADDRVTIFDTGNNEVGEMKALQRIPYGCKIALQDVRAGELLIKYGAAIGEVSRDIRAGELVHMHNLRSRKVDMPLSAKREIMRQLGYDLDGNRLCQEVDHE